jgi:hypothetical protein
MLIIEYNGAAHYGGVNWSGIMTEEELKRQFERQMYSDKLKADFCRDKGWPILWIPYTQDANLHASVSAFLDEHYVRPDDDGLLRCFACAFFFCSCFCFTFCSSFCSFCVCFSVCDLKKMVIVHLPCAFSFR